MLVANPALKSHDSHSILFFDPRKASKFDPQSFVLTCNFALLVGSVGAILAPCVIDISGCG